MSYLETYGADNASYIHTDNLFVEITSIIKIDGKRIQECQESNGNVNDNPVKENVASKSFRKYSWL